MRIEKWYGDCVASGKVDVLYLAAMQIGPVHWSYQARIGDNSVTKPEFSIGKESLPLIQDDRLIWSPSAHCKSGRVWAGAENHEQLLWTSNQRALVWNPCVLNAQVSEDGQVLGRGYAEKMTLNFGPWHLGLKRLIWGRFCGQLHSLVWILWEGKSPSSWLWLNRQRVESPEIRIGSVSAGICRLEMSVMRAFWEERLIEGSLRELGFFRSAGALNFLGATQTKYTAQGRLALADSTFDEGYVVCEEVRWP
jgi:hypothetical protein